MLHSYIQMSLATCKMKVCQLGQVFIIVMLCHHASGQVNESFDTDLEGWSGQLERFTVENERLRLQAPEVDDRSYLVTPNALMDHVLWSFYVEMDFATSSTSFTRIYLVADSGDLNGEVQGYFVQIGDTEDEISLYRQDGVSVVRVIDGEDKSIEGANVGVSVWVARNAAGIWTLWYEKNDSLIQEGSSLDMTYTKSVYLGFQCTYIASRSKKFYFDDVLAKADHLPPVLVHWEFVSTTELELALDEPLHPTSAADETHYSLSGADLISVDVIGTKEVRLSFRDQIEPGDYILEVNGLRDLLDNVTQQTYGLSYEPPAVVAFREVVINELMVDPDPVIGLPSHEYVELYNRSEQAFDLAQWTWEDSRNTVSLPSYVLLPDERLLLVDEDYAQQFAEYGAVLGISDLPTLNNAGDSLALRDTNGVLVDALYYLEEASLDGQSMEAVNPEVNCAGIFNFLPSEAEFGGTPGEENSVFMALTDHFPPTILETTIDGLTIEVQLNEPLDSFRLPSLQVALSPHIELVGVRLLDADRLAIELAAGLLRQQEYLLTIDGLTDCSNNRAGEISIPIIQGTVPVPEQLHLSEILFNPLPGGVDFVELYNSNVSDYFDLGGWQLVTLNEQDEVDAVAVFENGTLLPPGGWLAFTKDPEALNMHFPQAPAENLVALALPPLNDGSDRLVLTDDQGQWVERLDYDDGFHFELLDDVEGVSLERVNYSAPANDYANWRSAAQSVGFATPGQANSQSMDLSSHEGSLSVEPKVFLPGNFGTGRDFTTIGYALDRPGWVGTMEIFDTSGRPVNCLLSQSTLAQSGFVRWDGTNARGERVGIGYYLVLLRLFDLNGREMMMRETVVVGVN